MDGKQFGGIRFEICHSIGSITIIALNEESLKVKKYGEKTMVLLQKRFIKK